MGKRSQWHERLSVQTTDKNLIGHADAVLLRRCADKVGLTEELNKILPRGEGPGMVGPGHGPGMPCHSDRASRSFR
jgi:hypothetical protein